MKSTLALLLLLLITGCDTSPEAPPQADPTLGYVVPVRQLDEQTALTMETSLLTTPGDIQARIDLLWYYRGQFGNPFAERGANRQIMWFIANKPRAAVLATPVAELSLVPDRAVYDEARHIWLKHAEKHPKDAKVLGNAGVFLWRDDPAAAVPLLEQAHLMEPDNAAWPQALAEAYRKQAMAAQSPAREPLAKLSLAMYERAADRTPSVRQRMILLARAGSIARHVGDQGQAAVATVTKAVELTSIVDPGPDVALVIHAWHITLGLHHVATGQVDVARNVDLAAAAASIKDLSVTLALSELDMTLAKELLDRGHKEAVITYLEACAKATQSSEATRWVEAVKTGSTPEFGEYMH